jgi:hypothetical protein
MLLSRRTRDSLSVTPTTLSQAAIGLGAIPADDCRRTWPAACGRTNCHAEKDLRESKT